MSERGESERERVRGRGKKKISAETAPNGIVDALDGIDHA